jgi:hypothetical protein
MEVQQTIEELLQAVHDEADEILLKLCSTLIEAIDDEYGVNAQETIEKQVGLREAYHAARTRETSTHP